MNGILFGERIEGINKYGWVTLYNSRKENPLIENDTLLGKKSIIFLPGDGTKSEQMANGCCGAVKKMLILAGVSQKNMPHFYGLAYIRPGQDKHRYQILTEIKQTPFGLEPPSPLEEQTYYQPFFDTYILPMIVDKNGQAHSSSEIIKNLQNVTFASHCHGGFLAYQIEKMIAEKLAEFYPKQMLELMSNIRMIHFSSRRPKGINLWGKHLDIISQNDGTYADSALLEYDDIHKQIHRAPLLNESALISVSPNEEILVLKKLTNTFSEFADDDHEHTKILGLFSGENTNLLPQNRPIVQLARQVFRYFVEHPEDERSVEAQMKDLNSALVDRNIKFGKEFLDQEK